MSLFKFMWIPIHHISPQVSQCPKSTKTPSYHHYMRPITANSGRGLIVYWTLIGCRRGLMTCQSQFKQKQILLHQHFQTLTIVSFRYNLSLWRHKLGVVYHRGQSELEPIDVYYCRLLCWMQMEVVEPVHVEEYQKGYRRLQEQSSHQAMTHRLILMMPLVSGLLRHRQAK